MVCDCPLELLIRVLHVTQVCFWFDGTFPASSANNNNNNNNNNNKLRSNLVLGGPTAAMASLFSCIRRCCSSSPRTSNNNAPRETQRLVGQTNSSTTQLLNPNTRNVHFGHTRERLEQVSNAQLIQQSLIELPFITPENFEELNALEMLVERADENETLWLSILMDMIVAIPLGNPLSEPAIAIIVDQLPNPDKHTFAKAGREMLKVCNDLSMKLEHTKQGKNPSVKTVTHLRNLLVILGVLAEKHAGPMSEELFGKGLALCLLQLLQSARDPLVQLHACVTIEKFAKTGANKNLLMGMNAAQILVMMENALCSSSGTIARNQNIGSIVDEYRRCQTGFCVMWSLDNVFPCDGRKYSVERLDLSDVNVMLDVKDATKHLKLAPDGLEIRNDALSFESVRATCCAQTQGQWYFEVTLFTSGIMQIGWATDQCAYQSEEGVGIGDDPFSFAYDGCRRFLWHDQQNSPISHPKWKQGDVLGALIDLDTHELNFSLNGKFMKTPQKFSGDAYYPAASLMTFQHVMFNFGNSPYRFPPTEMKFRSLHETGSMTDEEKRIVPRLVVLEQLRREQEDSDSNAPTCTICYDRPPAVVLLPCKHDEFCGQCAHTLQKCPLCRSPIDERQPLGVVPPKT